MKPVKLRICHLPRTEAERNTNANIMTADGDINPKAYPLADQALTTKILNVVQQVRETKKTALLPNSQRTHGT